MYLPLMVVVLARVVEGKKPRRFAAGLLGLLWTVPALVGLQRLNGVWGWWTYADSGAMLRGMPLELLVGWGILWGVVPAMALGKMRTVWVVALLAALDCVMMPVCTGSVRLSPRWLVGEVVALGLVLLPGVLLARWTEENRRLAWRAGQQVMTSGMLFLFLVPEICFALRPGAGWGPLVGMAGGWRHLVLEGVVGLAVPGVSAAMEFAERGGGTPIPYDPPGQLVTSGVYRYVANPMQLSCFLVMAAWAWVLRSELMLAAAGISVAYSAGIAWWDEGEDLRGRFGEEWFAYRTRVRNWIPRWRPYVSGDPAVVYMARTCGACCEVRGWIEARGPVGLVIRDAEDLPAGSIRRMRYVEGTYAVEGVRAMARVLEHVNLGWALAGCAMRLPGVWWGIQLVMDVSGLGPRVVGVRGEADSPQEHAL
jgi:protein-S-isoprenylcysteine O-methyltransferase Ste14